MLDQEQDLAFMAHALQLAEDSVRKNIGGPFGAVVVVNNTIIAEGSNLVTANNDPTAHAEIVALRQACKAHKSFRLDDATLYSSCEPCPMCAAALLWARVGRVVYAASGRHAAAAGFDDEHFRALLFGTQGPQHPPHFEHLQVDDPARPFRLWQASENRIEY